MEFEPQVVVFRDVRLHQSYTTNLCITNPMSASVDFTIRCSSTRYSVSPNRVHLQPKQSIVITIKLFLNHYPKISQSTINKSIEDYLHIKSTYFDQKVPLEFFLSASLLPSMFRSASPPVRRNELSSTSNQKPTSTLHELQAQVNQKDRRIADLEAQVAGLESKYPDLQAMIRLKLEEERASFEEKSQKVNFSKIQSSKL